MSDERDDKPGRKGPRAPGGKSGGDRPRPRPGARTEAGDAPKRAYKPRAEGGDDRPRKPYQGKPRAPGGEDRPRSFRPKEGAGGADRPQRSFRPRAEGEGGDRPRKPFRPKAEGAAGEERPRTFRPRPEGGGDSRPNKPFRPREDRDRAPDGASKPGRRERTESTGGETRTFRPREDRGDAPREKRPFREREGGERPARPRDGARPFRDRPDGDRKPFASRGGSSDTRPRRDEAAPEEGERIAKRLARAGISSRRDAEEMIAAGRVKVNGKVLSSPAMNVGRDDVIHVDNELIPAIERTRLFLFHKPGGVVTTNRDPEGRKTVFDVLPEGLPRLMTIGRLDINTEGLLLLTNDGGLARVLELPATGWLRRYRVRVHGRVDEKALASLKDGIAVDGVFYGSIEASLDREQGTNAWLTIGLREGKNREVKNVLGALGLDVSRLIRVSFGPFQLGELAEGAVQELKGRTLRDQLGERLIAEAGANFDAPVVTEFANRPVARSRDEVAETKPVRRERAEPGEGGLIKNRKRAREDHREDVLGRLGTKPERGRGEGRPEGRFGGKPDGKFAGKPRGKSEKPFEPPKTRSANVWMAPGARPQTKASATTPDKPSADRPTRKRAADPNARVRGPRKPRRDD